jgi:hypothetical protein
MARSPRRSATWTAPRPTRGRVGLQVGTGDPALEHDVGLIQRPHKAPGSVAAWQAHHNPGLRPGRQSSGRDSCGSSKSVCQHRDDSGSLSARCCPRRTRGTGHGPRLIAAFLAQFVAIGTGRQAIDIACRLGAPGAWPCWSADRPQHRDDRWILGLIGPWSTRPRSTRAPGRSRSDLPRCGRVKARIEAIFGSRIVSESGETGKKKGELSVPSRLGTGFSLSSASSARGGQHVA